jgi:hypothetical protein
MTQNDSTGVSEMFSEGDTGAVWRSGTGVPPVDHAQDARATFKLHQYFCERARDVTPATARDAVSVVYAPVSSDPEEASRCASVLSDDERERSKRFVTKESQDSLRTAARVSSLLRRTRARIDVAFVAGHLRRN